MAKKGWDMGTYNAAESDNETSHEDEADADFAAPGDIEFEEVVERKDEDDDVVGDVEGAEGVELGRSIDAVTFM